MNQNKSHFQMCIRDSSACIRFHPGIRDVPLRMDPYRRMSAAEYLKQQETLERAKERQEEYEDLENPV